MNKKAQITMFVVLGLVLLIVFIIIMLIRNALKPETPNVQKLLNELQTGSIKNHITNCISEVSMDALEKIGASGGVIYDFEGGTIPFNSSRIGWEYLNHTSFDKVYFVRYGIRENKLCNQVNYTIPGYPYASTPFDELSAIYNAHCLYDSVEYSRYGGFYGQQILSKLCSIARESTCESFALGAEHALTIQKQLEDYVAQELPKCVNFSAFTARMPVDITTQSDPMIESTIHNSDVLVTAKYPIKITFEGQKPITKIIDYQTTIRARLGLLYNFLSNVLSLDSQNIGFDMVINYTHSNFWRQGFELRKTNNPCLTCELPFYHDDVIEVTDWKSLVNGKPFIFRAAIENRRPAIDVVEDMGIDLAETNFVIQRLKAYDPDDISINYYLLSFNFGENRCRGTASVPPGDPPTPGPGGGWCERDPRVSDVSTGELLRSNLLWMPVEKEDMGTHKLAILGVDDSGLFDYHTFTVNITDSRYDDSPGENCIKECIVEACSSYASDADQCGFCTQDCNVSACDWAEIFKTPGKGPYRDCREVWCTNSENACDDVCADDTYVGWRCYLPGSGGRTLSCRRCTYNIGHSGDPEGHVNCHDITNPGACISHMPNCFWVRENQSNTFVESCFNDTMLHTVSPPAYIIFN